MKSLALIPARSGSKRVPNKNILPLAGHPMIAYTIRAAIDSGVFDSVVCATDSEEYADIARYYGAEVPFLRPAEISGDKSPDIEWVKWVLNSLKLKGREYDVFSILRPTSPFRMPETIRRAWDMFINDPTADSLRAVQKCKQHPGKMWVLRDNRMLPLLPFSIENTPWHSSQYAALPEVYVQDASLEIAWSRIVYEKNTISGDCIIPFVGQDFEGFDINNEEDIVLANSLIKNAKATLPTVQFEQG